MNLCVLVCFQVLAFDVVRANNDAALLHKLHSDEEHLRTLVVLLSLTGGLALSFALGIGIFLYWHVREYKRRRQRRLRRRHEKLMSLTTAIHHPTPSHPCSDEEDDIIIQAPVQPLATSSPVSRFAAGPYTPEAHIADTAEEEEDEAGNDKEEEEDEAYHSSISKTPATSSSPVPPMPATESARETAPPSAPSAKELLIVSSSSRVETNAEASSSSATSCCPHCPSPFMVSTTLMDTVDPPPPAYQQVDSRSRDEGPLGMLYDPETAAAASFVANQPIYSNQN